MTSYSLLLPEEYKQEMAILADEEFGRLIRFLADFAFDGIDDRSRLTGNEIFFADRVLTFEDRHRDNYFRTLETKHINGRRGGRPKADNETDAL